MRRDSGAECPGRPSASWVLGLGRLSRSAVREEGRGHTEDGREGGVNAAGCECGFWLLKRSPPLLCQRAHSSLPAAAFRLRNARAGQLAWLCGVSCNQGQKDGWTDTKKHDRHSGSPLAHCSLTECPPPPRARACACLVRSQRSERSLYWLITPYASVGISIPFWDQFRLCTNSSSAVGTG